MVIIMLKKTISVIAAAFITTALALTLGCTSARAVAVDGYDVPIDIVVNGTYLDNPAKGYLGADNVTYVPVKELYGAIGAEITADEVTGTITVKKDSTELLFNIPASCCLENGKMTFAGLRYESGVLYAPVRFLAEAMGGTVSWDDYRYEVDVTFPGVNVNRRYAETDYNAEDLLWLSRIVTCEAGSVSFEAKVMVANVVINRRADKSFPDSIHDVIFDKKFGIQFPPAHNGRIYSIPTPSTHTIMACKAALNGLELAPDCLYFSYTSDNFSWVYHNRRLYTTIGNQAFYL